MAALSPRRIPAAWAAPSPETDFPHPTSLHPNPLERVSTKISTLRPETRRKVMGENAAALYRI